MGAGHESYEEISYDYFNPIGIHSKIRAFQSREGHPKETSCVYTDRFPLSRYRPLPLVYLLILLMGWHLSTSIGAFRMGNESILI